MYSVMKRSLDLLGSAILLILTAPVAIAIAISVLVSMGRPVLFRQSRPGRNERLFTCLKFRTMRNTMDENGKLLPDSARLTSVGLFIRRTSLDELPQLWNIFRGELSFVGPRPLLSRYLPYYTLTERRRHLVLPGLTGWAQVNGRNYVDFDQRLALDVWYVDNRSWLLDLKILIRTIWIVLWQRGVADNPEGPVTALDVQRSRIQQGGC